MALVIKKGSKPGEIREILKKLQEKSAKGLDAKSHCGAMKIEKDPLKVQKELRDEWG